MSRGLRSAAVMNRRHEPHDSLDDFPTPGWATRAVCEALQAQGISLANSAAWDPCCNRGFMVNPLNEYFGVTTATDIHDYGFAGMDEQQDFLLYNESTAPVADWIFINPPFKLGLHFIRQALRLTQRGVAVFVRTNFVEGQERYKELFVPTPESMFMPFVERVVLWKGVMLDPDKHICRVSEKGEVTVEKPTTATSYCWLIFEKGHVGPGKLIRIAPCRKRLTRPGDYPELPDDLNPELVIGPDWKTASQRPVDARQGSLAV